MSLDRLFTGEGVKEIRIVWGTFRGRSHAYRFNIFGMIDGRPFGSVMYITLCGRSLSPKGSKTVRAAERSSSPPRRRAFRSTCTGVRKSAATPPRKPPFEPGKVLEPMSFDIDDALREGDAMQTALHALREKYPRATLDGLPDGRQAWTSATIEPTGVMFLADKKKNDVYACPYEKLGPVHVFAPASAWERANDFFERIAKSDPGLHSKLIEKFGSE